ncbi:RidA family protein [Nonomuraea indica]|uniref:RidA family protein n=1 Tax=Nonomuraea indica TaxID=1581193 RepID=UPI000C7A128B|nr:RidA family protein [Nonomuraea indica]
MIHRWSPAGVGAPVAQYSHLASVPASHGLLFISGQVGVREDGVLSGPDAESQTRQAFANIGALLAAAGAEPRHLVKLFTMVAGTEHLPGCRAARTEVFKDWFPDKGWPAHSLIVVSALAAPEIVVEVEAVAAIPPAAEPRA